MGYETHLDAPIWMLHPRRGGRVVECGSLENCFRVKPNGGSNPPLSVQNAFAFKERHISLLTNFGFKRVFGTEANKQFTNFPDDFFL